MQLRDVLSPDRIAVGLTATSKKTLLETASELLAESNGADSREIFDTLCQRERLGSTGLGHGVAIPHGRVEGQTETVAAILRLKRPISFDAPDNQPVDLFFVLAVPPTCTDAHLNLLAGVAELLGDPERREAIREAESPQAIMDLLGPADTPSDRRAAAP